MAVDFCDYFWGEKHEGFHVLYQNMKCGLIATKDFTDVVREIALTQENNAKVYSKISKQLGGSINVGSFGPMLMALKTASEKLSSIHSATLAKITELMKELMKYSEEMHKKQKQIKDEEAPTSDIVKSLQETTILLHKSKDFYKAKSVELEKLKRESPSPKELEKSESKFRKAQEDYKALCDKYSSQREEFEKKMTSSCKHFQQAETLYLTQMVDFIHTFHDLIDGGHNSVGKVNLELEEQLVQNTVEKMLEQFVLQKYTGLVKPGPIEFEAENISLSSLNAATAIGGGPPSDISDRSANSDKQSSTEKGPVSNVPGIKRESTGFLKNRRKKERKKSIAKTKDDSGDGEAGKEMGSDGEERGRSETPTPEDCVRLPPPSIPAPDPWADFNQAANKKSFYSSSDSDSDDEEVKKIKINIRPVTAGTTARAATSASVDELQRAVGGIDLSAATLPKRPTPSSELESSSLVRRSKSSSHSQDLLGLFPDLSVSTDTAPPDTGATQPDQLSVGLPGAESTRLDTSQSNTSKEVSDLLTDINELNNELHEVEPKAEVDEDVVEDSAPPPLPDSAPPPAPNLDLFADSVQPALPPKQRPASAGQREAVANSLIALPRPPSRARPDGRLRGTPSPTPTSILQSTNLSLPRSDSTGSADSRRVGPYIPTPPRTNSPSQHHTPLPHQSFTTSRGPSPLAVGGADTVPLAVAFQEVVHAAFRGAEESRCLVRLLGDMMLSFPAGIVAVLASNPYPAPLQFRVLNCSRLESVLPNKQLVTRVAGQSTDDCLVFEFNMTALQQLLTNQASLNPSASYFNIDILKYQISSLTGANSCPFHIMSYWRCEDNHTDLRIDYKYNQHAMARTTSLQNVSLAVPVDGGVTSMMSEPKGTWVQESSRAMWRFPEVSNSSAGVGSIRARFQLSDGPGSQGTVAAQFNCEGTTLSGVEFELLGSGYRVSLVKRRFVSGKYVSEPDNSGDRFRYAAPPPLASDC